mmetsp:Transcript_62819/g.132646  ORF Transcript_62819/g.132646 Transcript_62819/m.132646 type:complete len:304 (-) Transcript_62819:653-1564(-)
MGSVLLGENADGASAQRQAFPSASCSEVGLEQDETDAVRRDLGALPVVEVVLQVTITHAELQLLQKAVVLHDVQSVEDVEVVLLGEDEGIVHQLVQGDCGGHVPIGVRRVQLGVLLVAQDGGRQLVEGAHISDHTSSFADIGVNNAGTGKHPVGNLILREFRVQAELLEVIRQQFSHPLGVLGFHLPHARDLGLLGNLVKLDGPGHRHSGSQVGETDIDELLGVQGAVPVSAFGDRSGQHHASGVYCLPDVLPVHSAGNLLNKHRSQSLASQLLVDTEEVDLNHVDRVFVDLDVRGDASDEAD